MDIEKLTKVLKRKFPNYDFADKPNSLYFDVRQNFVVYYDMYDIDNVYRSVVFVGQGSTVFMDYLFSDTKTAIEYFEDNVRILL